PITLMLDDIQWGDAMSRQLLVGVLARLTDVAVLVISTSRPVNEGVFDREDTEFLFLEPLTRPQVLELLTGLGTLPDEPWAADFAPQLHRATTGSPLLVLETLELARERGLLTLEQPGSWTSPRPDALQT